MVTIIATAGSIVATVIAGIILHTIKDGQRKAQSREADRDERELLTLEAMNANFSVNKELVRCVKGEKPNGDLTRAYNYQEDVKHKLDDYMRRRASH